MIHGRLAPAHSPETAVRPEKRHIIHRMDRRERVPRPEESSGHHLRGSVDQPSPAARAGSSRDSNGILVSIGRSPVGVALLLHFWRRARRWRRRRASRRRPPRCATRGAGDALLVWQGGEQAAQERQVARRRLVHLADLALAQRLGADGRPARHRLRSASSLSARWTSMKASTLLHRSHASSARRS